jgi:hypothetical protein
MARIPVNGLSTGIGNGSNSSTSNGNNLIKPVHIVRQSALSDLPTSRFLLKTLRSKQTPMYRVQFTSRNLLLSGGVFQPKVES